MKGGGGSQVWPRSDTYTHTHTRMLSHTHEGGNLITQEAFINLAFWDLATVLVVFLFFFGGGSSCFYGLTVVTSWLDMCFWQNSAAAQPPAALTETWILKKPKQTKTNSWMKTSEAYTFPKMTNPGTSLQCRIWMQGMCNFVFIYLFCPSALEETALRRLV